MPHTPEEKRERERGTEKMYREANRDKIRARHRLWVERNPEKAKNFSRAWAEKNPEKNKDYCRKWAKTHPNKTRANNPDSPEFKKKKSIQAAIRYQANREEFKEKARRAQKLMSSERRFVHNHRHRAKKLGALGTVTEHEIRSLVNYYESTCAYCLHRKATQIDHIVPLAKGGANEIENLVPSCGTCNARKNSRSLEDHVERELALGRDTIVSVQEFWDKRVSASAFLSKME
jgi:5-methylcytosine-specific restriction endonuclease McrA